MDENGIYHEMRREVDFLLQTHMEEESIKFDLIQEDIKQLRSDMKAFTDAWQQAKGVVTFIKWLTSITGGLVAIFLFVKDHWK